MQSSDPSSSPVSTLTCYDYNRRYCGHCNTTTDIKEANFFGSAGNYIVAGSDGGPYLNDDYMGRGRGYKNADVVGRITCSILEMRRARHVARLATYPRHDLHF